MAKNELTVAANYQIQVLQQGMLDLINEEMEGLGPIPFDVVKVPSGGGLAFEVPGDDPDSPDLEKVLRGVIVHHHPVNAYWKDAYTGGSAQPDCSSLNGRTGVDTETGETNRCGTCPFNQYGSEAEGGRGKACKNGHRLYFLREGSMLPMIIMLPPTSIKPMKEYTARNVIKGRRLDTVITEISLVKDKNAGGIDYSKCSLKCAGLLSDEDMAKAHQMGDFVRSIAANVSVEDASPVNMPDGGAASADDDFRQVPENETVPF